MSLNCNSHLESIYKLPRWNVRKTRQPLEITEQTINRSLTLSQTCRLRVNRREDSTLPEDCVQAPPRHQPGRGRDGNQEDKPDFSPGSVTS